MLCFIAVLLLIMCLVVAVCQSWFIKALWWW